MNLASHRLPRRFPPCQCWLLKPWADVAGWGERSGANATPAWPARGDGAGPFLLCMCRTQEAKSMNVVLMGSLIGKCAASAKSFRHQPGHIPGRFVGRISGHWGGPSIANRSPLEPATWPCVLTITSVVGHPIRCKMRDHPARQQRTESVSRDRWSYGTCCCFCTSKVHQIR